jgi:hypothetical protein
MIITGEAIQQLCDVYLGCEEDFKTNPIINNDCHKHLNFNNLLQLWNNPKTIFCYGHRIRDFCNISHLLTNPFILITHNSDACIDYDALVHYILQHPLLIRWYGQNISFHHPKLHFIPIGIANRQWPHGDLSLLHDKGYNPIKKYTTYFNFKIDTNIAKRRQCYEALASKLKWLPTIPALDNQRRLSQYRFCICPEGNGYDTHRLWECLYFKVVPIVIDSPFTQILFKQNIPLFILKDWSDYNEAQLDYEQYQFTDLRLEQFMEL